MVYTGFWRRFLAFLLDGIFISIICVILIIPYFVSPLWVVVAGFYHVVFETSPLRATPGKALLKMSVVKSNGSKLTIKDSILRYIVSFLSSALFGIGYIMAIFNDKKQTLHDYIIDTVVVQETFAEVNFWQIFIEQCKVIFASQNTNNVRSQSLEDLYNLYQKGILTEDEYKTKKEEYLKRL